MSISCQIKVYKTSGNVVQPGNIVSGVLKYNIGEETVCNKITVSFKGKGYLLAKLRKRETNIRSYRKSEDYTSIDYIIYRHEAGDKLGAGSYQTEFHFSIPENIPPTVKYTNKTVNHLINCYITYYIRIKFEKSGIIKSIKKFKKPVTVIPIAIPKLPTEPTTYNHQQILKREFSRSSSLLKIAATVSNSVIVPGQNIKIQYEVNNDTHVNVKSILTKLIEIYAIKSKGGREITFVEDVNNTTKVSGIIRMQETKIRVVELTVPLTLGTLEYSNLISREYFVMIILELPTDYEDMVLKIPVQIGNDVHGRESNPPSYWDVLQEDGINNQCDDNVSLNDVDESETEL